MSGHLFFVLKRPVWTTAFMVAACDQPFDWPAAFSQWNNVVSTGARPLESIRYSNQVANLAPLLTHILLGL